MFSSASAPQKGEDFAKIEEDYLKYILPGMTHWQHPSFFAYFPVGCTFEGILGELYANCGSNPGFNASFLLLIITCFIDWILMALHSGFAALHVPS